MHGFRLGELTAEPRVGVVSGPAGRVHVDPKVMDVLIVLAERAGEVITREELLDRAWPGRIVGDDAVSRCVYQLRRHFVAAGGADRYKSLVETIPKRGYRLNCRAALPLEPGLESTHRLSTPPRERALPAASRATVLWIVAALAIGAVVWALRMQPRLEAPSANPEAYAAYLEAEEYFARPDRQNALPYAGQLYRQATILDPAFKLAWIGLARTHTDLYWHGIDRTPDRLAQAREALASLSMLDSDLPEFRLATANFLIKAQGRYEDAIAELESAAMVIPNEPELHFLRAMAYRRQGSLELSIESLDEAIALESDKILYLRQQYLNHQFAHQYDEAEQHLDRILRIRPDDGTTFVDKVVLALCRAGDTSLARRYEQAPPSAFYDDGTAYEYTRWLAAIYDRDYEGALAILDDAGNGSILDGDQRNNSFGPKPLFYARTHHLAGNTDLAREAYRSIIALIDQQLPRATEDDFQTRSGLYLALAEAQAHLDSPERALQSLQRARDAIHASGDAISISALQIQSVVRVLVPAGYIDDAFRELDRYLGNPVGHWSIEGLRRDPRLAFIVGDPRFEGLEEKYAGL